MVATVLAANSWFSFYEKVLIYFLSLIPKADSRIFQLLHSESEGQNLFSKFTEYIKDTNERCLEQSMDLQMQLVDSFNKLIILLPRNCEYGTLSNKPKFTIIIFIQGRDQRGRRNFHILSTTHQQQENPEGLLDLQGIFR